MLTRLGLIAALIGLTSSFPAAACSCAKPSTVREGLAKATAVFRAATISVSHDQRTVGDGTIRTYITERATLKVLEVWKGDLKVDDLVSVESDIGVGSCGRSVSNAPVSTEEAPPSGAIPPAKLSGEWIIFAYGKQPYSLSVCSLSKPIEAANGIEAELRQAIEPNGT